MLWTRTIKTRHGKNGWKVMDLGKPEIRKRQVWPPRTPGIYVARSEGRAAGAGRPGPRDGVTNRVVEESDPATQALTSLSASGEFYESSRYSG